MMIEMNHNASVAAIESAMRDIVSAAHRPEGSYVNVPVMYPSGSLAVVRVSGGPETFFVTDFGTGFMEAEMMGAEKIFLNQARLVGSRSGVSFDEHAFFAVRVNRARLPGAIISIANCSVEAVILTAMKAAEKVAVDSSEFLIAKLEAVFGKGHVNKKQKVIGASNHEWEFTASVQDGRRTSLFEFATAHPNSVASVAMKMNDISLLDHAPRRIVMVHSKADMGTYLGVLAHTASVVEDKIPDEQIKRLAEAA